MKSGRRDGYIEPEWGKAVVFANSSIDDHDVLPPIDKGCVLVCYGGIGSEPA